MKKAAPPMKPYLAAAGCVLEFRDAYNSGTSAKNARNTRSIGGTAAKSNRPLNSAASGRGRFNGALTGNGAPADE